MMQREIYLLVKIKSSSEICSAGIFLGSDVIDSEVYNLNSSFGISTLLLTQESVSELAIVQTVAYHLYKGPKKP